MEYGSNIFDEVSTASPICRDSWWDAGLSWNSAALPDFTDCFQASLLTSCTCVFVLIFTISMCCTSRRRKNRFNDERLPLEAELVLPSKLATEQQHLKNRMHSPWFYAKMIIFMILLVVCFSRLINTIVILRTHTAVLSLVGDCLEIIVLVLALVKTLRVQQRDNKYSSVTLFTLFALLLSCHVLRLYSFIVRCRSNDAGDVRYSALYNCPTIFVMIFEALIFGLCLALFLLNCFSDTYGRKRTDDEKESPLLTISVPAFLTFSWVFRLVYNGWRRALTYDDLWHLPQEISSAESERAFQQSWLAERKRAERHAKTPSLARALYNMVAVKFWLGFILQIVLVFSQYAGPVILKLLLHAVTLESEALPLWKGVFFAFMLFIASIGASLLENHMYRLTYQFAITFRSALTLSTYKKLYRLSNDARREWTIGELVNLLSVDSQRVLDFTTYMFIFVIVPVSVTLAVLLLWNELGPSALAGVAVLVIFMPVNAVTGALQHRLYSGQLVWKDKRMGYMSEILNGIKVLKLYAWEVPFMQRVMRCRAQEVRRLRASSLLEIPSSLAWEMTPIIMAMSCFALHVWLTGGNVREALTAEKMFVSMSLFSLLATPLGILPQIITLFVQCRVAIGRYSRLLLSDECDADAVTRRILPPIDDISTKIPAVCIRNGNFAWSANREAATILHDINLVLPRGSLTAVVGVVGAGKSSLCSAILGLMDRTNNNAVRVEVCGRVAYVPQQAWIRNESLKNNILFSQGQAKVDAVRYERVIDACALRADLDMLPAGDETEIGEKGVNLSGGQKQRVSLARAAYSDADVYILDDPLSAVDAHVASHLFDQLLSNRSGSLLANKTRLLVTHSTSVLPHVDMIIVLEEGHIIERGTYDELIQANGRLAELIQNLQTNNDTAANKNKSPASPTTPTANTAYARSVSTATGGSFGITPRVGRTTSVASAVSHTHGVGGSALVALPDFDDDDGAFMPLRRTDRQTSHNNNNDATEPLILMNPAGATPASPQERVKLLSLSQSIKSGSHAPPTVADAENARGSLQKQTSRTAKLIEQEEAQVGNVSAGVYLLYARLMSITLSSICFAAYFGYQVFQVAAQIWLVEWSSSVDKLIAASSPSFVNENKIDDKKINEKTDNFFSWQKRQLAVFAGIGGGMAIFLGIASTLLTICTVRAMYYLHKRMLERVMHAPMSFFDTTPLGRLINRFARDIDSIDTELPARMRPLMQIIVSIVGILVLICYGSPAFIVVVVVLFVLFVFVQRFYIYTSRQLRRIETINRSPIFSHFSETAQGMAVIKAMQSEATFLQQFQKYVDAANVPFFYWFYADRWVFLALNVIGSVAVLFASMFAILSRHFGLVALSPSVLGLVISNALNLSMPLQWFVRIVSEAETYIVSVERIREYMENVPQEASWDTTVGGEKSLSAHWPAHGRVQLDDYATRYRAGLELVLDGVDADVRGGEKIGIVGRTGAGKSSLTLALFRIVEAARGRIVIDGVNVHDIGLHDLRSRLTIIPQEPIVFSGTLRFNIDPEEAYTDANVWEALEHAHLKDWVELNNSGLQMVIAEDGQNLSVGQRQLVCLARALLRKPRVLVLDEATAAVDAETDELIQRTIRREFADATVLTIAHRLHTVLDCDRVMVVDSGKVKEFESPKVLLAQPTSALSRLARAAAEMHDDQRADVESQDKSVVREQDSQTSKKDL